ncbi:MarR family transcriptional regulator [Actinoplanes sp. NPDC051633]|uniref:MarR family winged helix-turn-helix transcriptional regulator n=1 Tax=Actinoplanes sp. NPDC051633 TaxID=3155670 RepID=UPI00343F496F
MSLKPLTSEEEAVMRALGRLMLVLPRVLDADLEQGERMSLSEYSALRHLSEAEGRRLRMSDLAAACDMSLSGMTRLAGKLESLGYLQRRRCERDARGMDAVLTDAGLRRLEAAWPTHLESVRKRIFTHLEGLDMGTLARALEAMSCTKDRC